MKSVRVGVEEDKGKGEGQRQNRGKACKGLKLDKGWVKGRKKNMRGKGASGKRASRGGGDGLASARGRICLPSGEGRVKERQQDRRKGRT